jgi:hypothetical protein
MNNGEHWYYPDGRCCYEIERSDGKGMRPTTLRDARKLGLLPSVTGILGVLDKPALNEWKIKTAVHAIITAPDVPGETLDQKYERVLVTERQQDQESKIARDRGTAIHDAMEKLCIGQDIDPEIAPWVKPAFDAVLEYGEYVGCEKVLVGEGYAGKADLLLEGSVAGCFWLWDWKSAKKLPDPAKGAWFEHRLQLAAYAAALDRHESTLKIRTGNIYISTVEQGKFVICEHPDWKAAYHEGFGPLVTHWQFANGYYCPSCKTTLEPSESPA